MINDQFNEMAEAVGDAVNAGNALIAAGIALLVGLAIFIRRYIISNK